MTALNRRSFVRTIFAGTLAPLEIRNVAESPCATVASLVRDAKDDLQRVFNIYAPQLGGKDDGLFQTGVAIHSRQK
jgi:hypothetical protein